MDCTRWHGFQNTSFLAADRVGPAESHAGLGYRHAHGQIRAIVLWGAPRVHGELLKLGTDVSESTVARYMGKGPRLPSPTWCSFIHNHFSEIIAIMALVDNQPDIIVIIYIY